MMPGLSIDLQPDVRRTRLSHGLESTPTTAISIYGASSSTVADAARGSERPHPMQMLDSIYAFVENKKDGGKWLRLRRRSQVVYGIRVFPNNPKQKYKS
jgi:hypothetical protein